METRPGSRRLAAERALSLEFVENYHAADASRISERALAAGGSPGDDPDEQRMARVLDGYDRVADSLAESVRDAIRLRCVVMRVAWERGEVRLTLAPESIAPRRISARAAIITVPLGVLLAAPDERGAIVFDPPIGAVLAHARGLSMGHALRIALLFRERFWDDGRMLNVPDGTSLASMSFLHTHDADIPVWWTAHPIRSTLLVGWAGGPRASRLLMQPHDAIEHRALAVLARQLGMQTRTLRRALQRSWMHDWAHDPFARGVYSYIVVDGGEAARRLARPVERTLFFAGEAADPEGRLGTVNGAIASGLRAAGACRRALSE
jgi:monoamine oxidase